MPFHKGEIPQGRKAKKAGSRTGMRKRRRRRR